MLLVLSVVLLLFLGLTGIVLDQAFRNSVEAGAAERFQVQVYLLLAALEQEDGAFYVLQDIQEPRYSQLNSGLYGYVYGVDGKELWRSDSARTLSLDVVEQTASVPEVGQGIFELLTDYRGEQLFRFSYGILWEGSDSPYFVSVVELAAPYLSQIRDFRASLGRWLGGAALLLLMVLLMLLAWGLRPLGKLEQQIRRVEDGESERLEGEFPDELSGLTTNLNRLIESERRQRERYRTTLADLAHSLKTPLSVATGALYQLSAKGQSESKLDPSEQVHLIDESLHRMDQIIGYQLKRAVASQGQSPLTSRVDVAGVIEELLGALRKVYSEHPYSVETRLQEDVIFRGDEHDLLEVLGNVLDNAFKYGRSKISIALRTLVDGSIEIVIEDDGQGIVMEQREFVLQRGARADTLASGQGIGLAVVSELMASYQGSVTIDNSSLGGAKFTLIFPATKSLA